MLIVKKFGGTSVANKERIFNVANRCKSTEKEMTWLSFCPQWGNIRMN